MIKHVFPDKLDGAFCERVFEALAQGFAERVLERMAEFEECGVVE